MPDTHLIFEFTYMPHSHVPHFVINLPSSQERREKIAYQANKLKINIQFIKAISGKDLDIEKLSNFNRLKRNREHILEMSPNEHACLASHLKTLDLFVQSQAPFCIISEDDVIFKEDFMEKTEFLLSHTTGWDYIKLLNEGIHYPLISYPRDSHENYLTLTFPKNLSYCTSCILYTRQGALKVLKYFKNYWMPFDSQLGYISVTEKLIGLSCLPPLVILDRKLTSAIGHSKSPRRTFHQWFNHRIEKSFNSYRKRRLLRLIRKKFEAKPSSSVLCRI